MVSRLFSSLAVFFAHYQHIHIYMYVHSYTLHNITTTCKYIDVPTPTYLPKKVSLVRQCAYTCTTVRVIHLFLIRVHIHVHVLAYRKQPIFLLLQVSCVMLHCLSVALLLFTCTCMFLLCVLPYLSIVVTTGCVFFR